MGVVVVVVLWVGWWGYCSSVGGRVGHTVLRVGGGLFVVWGLGCLDTTGPGIICLLAGGAILRAWPIGRGDYQPATFSAVVRRPDTLLATVSPVNRAAAGVRPIAPIS